MSGFDAGYWGPEGAAGNAPAPPIDEPQANAAVGPGGFDASLDQALNSGALQEAPGDPKELIAATPPPQANGAPAPESIVGAPEMGTPAPQPATDAILDQLPPPKKEAPTLASKTLVAGNFPGLLSPGNIDLTNRPDVANKDGTHSSVRSMSFEVNGKEVLVPTVSEDGRIMTDAEAMDQYRRTGRNLGIFKDPASATAYAQALHEQQAGAMGSKSPATAATPVTGEKVIDEQHALDLQAAEDAKRQAEAAHMAAIDHQADVQDATDKGNAVLSSRQKAYDDALAKYSNAKIQDYWDEPGHSKLRAKLAIALGGFGAALSARAGGSTENVAVTQIDKQIADDFQRQKAQIEQARDNVVMARTGINDAKEAKASLLEDANAKRTATLQTLETEARQSLAERGVPAAQIDMDQRVLQLQAARVKAQREADEQKRKDAMAEAQIAYLQARAGKLKGGGSGGGGSGGKQQALAAALTKSGGEITPEVAAVADSLKIKPTDLRGMAASFKQERRADLADRKTVDAEVNKFAQDNQLPEITKRYKTLTKVDSLLSKKDVDPETQIQVLQEYEKASKGGTATAASMQASLAHLAGGTDKIDQFMEKVKTGGLSQAQLGNLRTSIRAALAATKDEADTAHDQFQQTFRNMDTYPDQKIIDHNADTYFSAFGYKREPKGGGGAAASAPAAKPATMVIGNTVYRLQPDGTYK